MNRYHDYILAFGANELVKPTETILSENKDILPYFIVSALFFSSLCIGLPKVIQYFAPSYYNGMSLTKKKELPTYSACLVHHLVVVPWGIYKISQDFHSFQSNGLTPVNDLFGSNFVPYTFGYIFGDTVFLAVQEAYDGKPAFLIHHMLSFLLLFSVLNAPLFCSRYIPHFLLTESSSIFFATAWFLRAGGLERKTSHTLFVFEVLFAITFFFTRVVNLLLVMIGLCSLPQSWNLSVLCMVVVPIYGLQLYWFTKIVLSMQPKKIAKSE